MIVRMIHPNHGAMHAYDASEVERLKANGWTEEVQVPVAVKQEEPAVTEVVEPQRKKPGRPKKVE